VNACWAVGGEQEQIDGKTNILVVSVDVYYSTDGLKQPVVGR